MRTACGVRVLPKTDGAESAAIRVKVRSGRLFMLRSSYVNGGLHRQAKNGDYRLA